VVHDPDHDILAAQSKSICGGAKPRAHNWLVVRHHLEELLNLLILVKRLAWESRTPHGASGRPRANLTTNKLLALRSDTIGRNDYIRFVYLAVVGRAASLASLLVLKVIDNLAVELDGHAQLLNSVHKHLVYKRAHLKLSRRRIGVQSEGSQTVRDLLGANDDLARVLEGLDPAVMKRNLLVFLEEFWPVLQEARCAQSHEVHVTLNSYELRA
jgi:hypothetical protein